MQLSLFEMQTSAFQIQISALNGYKPKQIAIQYLLVNKSVLAVQFLAPVENLYDNQTWLLDEF